MKFITIILSLLILVLSIKPCSDGNNTEDQQQDEISDNHNHQNDSDDTCPIN
jgi:ABC-type Fe3+-citrate transport system substrate-binding protein